MNALFNGKFADEWTQSRALHFGDGAFRTLLVWDGQIADWDLHLQKLSQDCIALQLKMPEASLLRAEAEQLSHQCKRAALKIIVWRQTEGRGYGSRTEETDRVVLVQPAPAYPLTHWTTGVRTFLCSLRLAAQPALAGIKHLNRLEQVLASRDWPNDREEGILCDCEGNLISGVRSNLFWVTQGMLRTPSLDTCGVSGIMRNKIMQRCRVNHLNVSEATMSYEALHKADEVFICNSLLGIWPVRQFENHIWQAPGPMTLKLQDALNHPRLTE